MTTIKASASIHPRDSISAREEFIIRRFNDIDKGKQSGSLYEVFNAIRESSDYEHFFYFLLKVAGE